MKVLVVAPYAGWCPTFEYELEIIQDHLDAGDEVCIVVCNAALATCDLNPTHDCLKCSRCVGRRLFGLAQLTQPVRQLSILHMDPHDLDRARQLPRRFGSLQEVRDFKIDNFDLGLAALSSVIAVIKEPKPDITDKSVARLLHRFMISAFAVYRSTLHLLDDEGVDLVYVLNGRLAPLRAVMRACEWAGVDFYTHERGWNLQHYSLHKNTMIHNVDYMKGLILDSWTQADPLEREQLATDYFQKRAQGEGFNWMSFVIEQTRGELPANWDVNLHNVVLYCSSDHETSTLGEMWTGPIYEDHMTGIESIAAAFRDWPDKHLYLRLHPNSRGLDNSTTRRLLQLGGPGVTVIPADSPVSSYALLRSSAKSVTFNSRMGIEAAFWGVPSILAGKTVYRELGSTYNPLTHADMLEVLQQNLVPKDKTGALQYGHFFRTFGRRAKYFEPTDLGRGKFRSIELRETGLYHEVNGMLDKHRRLRRLASWASAQVNSLRMGGDPSLTGP